MYPTKESLEQKWWHRLAKIVFIIAIFFIVVISAFLFYFAEETNARDYRIVMRFSDLLQQEKEIIDRGCGPEITIGVSPTCFGGRFLAPETFINKDDLKDYALGCLQDNKKIEYLYEYQFKENTTCDKETGSVCSVSKSVCGGNTANIVKYDYETKYQLNNYFSIFIKTFGVFLGCIIFVYLFYYKALLYIIFGKK